MSEEKKDKSYTKEQMDKCTEKYAQLKGARPKGNQWLPIQQQLKKLAEDGEDPKDVMGCMEYLKDELGYDDWTMKTVWKKMADYKGWKKKQKEKEQRRKEKKWEYQDGPSIEEIEEFQDSYSTYKEKSSHGDSPWLFEHYLDAAGIIHFEIDEDGNFKKIVIRDSARYERARELWEGLKSYEDEQITNEAIAKELDQGLGASEAFGDPKNL